MPFKKGKKLELIKDRYELAEGLRPRVRAILSKFSDLFQLQDTELVILYFRATKSKVMAKTRLVPEAYHCLAVQPIMIEVWLEGFEQVREGMKNLILYRELSRIEKDEKGEFYLKDYDFKDFYEIVEKVGLKGEKAEEVFAKVYDGGDYTQKDTVEEK